MEEVISRFPDLGELVFLSVDEESLENCKNVSTLWKKLIENPSHKFRWIKIIKDYEERVYLKEFVCGSQNWSKLKIKDLKEFVMRLEEKKNHLDIEEIFLEKYEALNVKLIKGCYGNTALIWACMMGQLEIARILFQKSAVFDIDPNAKNPSGMTAFHYACVLGKLKIVDMMIKFNVDLTIKTKNGLTGFQFAERKGREDIVNLIKRSLPANKY